MHSGRLLILDDDAQVGQTIRLIAESLGMSARLSTGAADFFDAVDCWQPTHIALDLVMPDMDGVEVLVRLAERNCCAALIITSGVGHRVLDAAGRAAAGHGLNIAGVLSKPFRPGALRELLGVAAGIGVTNAPARAAPAAASVRHFDVTASELHRALDRRELQLLYQPKVECTSGEPTGFEALLRWMHPEQGLIMPDHFVPFAEANGLIDAVTEHVLDLALAWFARHFGSTELHLAVNLSAATASNASLAISSSARTLQDQRFIERVVARCQRQGVDPTCLIFELTETSAMEDPVASLDLLTRIRMKGFQLSIDDFGTGFSSMVQLVRLPFSEIKIDKSFVLTAIRSQESRAVVKSVVDLGHSLGLRVVAEGVEDAATMQYLREIGCDLAQGYFIARPMTAGAVHQWLARRRRRPA